MSSLRSEATSRRAVHESGGRAQPGLRSVLALIVLAAAVVGAVIHRVGASRSTAPHYSYGGLPNWLPSTSLSTNRVLEASVAHPQMAIEGDVVKFQIASAQSTVVLVGPTVPPFVAPPPPATTATFTVTFRQGSAPLTVRARDFALIDGNGDRFHPLAFVGGASTLKVAAHVSESVRIREYMAVGSGSIRWAPGGHPLVTWEYTVEND